MEIYFKPSFLKDFQKLPSDIKREVRYICAEVFPKLRDIYNFKLYKVKPIKGFKNYFRIKIGDYRIGFKMIGNNIEFMRVKHRKDIYKFFP